MVSKINLQFSYLLPFIRVSTARTSVCNLFSPGSQGVLRVTLLFDNESALPAALGAAHAEELPGQSSAKGGSRTRPAHIHQELPASRLQRLCTLRELSLLVLFVVLSSLFFPILKEETLASLKREPSFPTWAGDCSTSSRLAMATFDFSPQEGAKDYVWLRKAQQKQSGNLSFYFCFHNFFFCLLCWLLLKIS